MYIEKLEVKKLSDNKDGLATVLLSEKEIATLDNLMYELSKEKVLTETEHSLKRFQDSSFFSRTWNATRF